VRAYEREARQGVVVGAARDGGAADAKDQPPPCKQRQGREPPAEAVSFFCVCSRLARAPGGRAGPAADARQWRARDPLGCARARAGRWPQTDAPLPSVVRWRDSAGQRGRAKRSPIGVGGSSKTGGGVEKMTEPSAPATRAAPARVGSRTKTGASSAGISPGPDHAPDWTARPLGGGSVAFVAERCLFLSSGSGGRRSVCPARPSPSIRIARPNRTKGTRGTV